MLARWIAERARKSPTRIAAVWNGQSFSYETLSRIIASLRTDLAAQPAPRGVSILLVENLFIGWCWVIALRSLGHTTIVLRTPLEIAALDLGTVDLIVADRIDALSGEPGSGDKATTAVLPSKLPKVGDSPLQPDFRDLSRQQGGHILLSSGTTGVPKKVLITAAGDEADVDLHADIMVKSTATRYFAGAFLLNTAAGYRGALRTWAAGGAVVFDQRQDPTPQILAGDITDADFTPRTLNNLLSALPDRLVRNNRMRLNILGGALPWRLFLEARNKLTDRIYSVFGATEAGVIAQTKIESQQDLTAHDVAPHRTVQIVGAHGEPRRRGEIGALRVAPAPGVTGYLGDDAATDTFFKDGFFYTGDLARWVGDGRLELIGRSSSVINILGDKRSPEPLEQKFKDRFDLSDTCIFSSPSLRGGDALHVVIESAEPPSPEILAHMRSAFSSMPEVHFHFIPKFPRNAMGKFARTDIKNMALNSIYKKVHFAEPALEA